MTCSWRRTAAPGYFVNHYYDATDGGAPRLNVRTLTWGRDGWPVVSDPINPEPLDRPRRRVRADRPPGRHARSSRTPAAGTRARTSPSWHDLDNRVPAVAALRPRERHPDPQPVQQQRRRGRRVPERRRRQRRAVGLARVPAEQRLPALELRGGGRRLDDGRERAARQPRLDGAGRPGGGRQRRDQHPDRVARTSSSASSPSATCCWRARRARRRPSVPTLHRATGAGTVTFEPRDDRRARPGGSIPCPGPRATPCAAPTAGSPA